jgi:hypothetical protein
VLSKRAIVTLWSPQHPIQVSAVGLDLVRRSRLEKGLEEGLATRPSALFKRVTPGSETSARLSDLVCSVLIL